MNRFDLVSIDTARKKGYGKRIYSGGFKKQK